MKKQPLTPTEQEQYFARKNRRHKMWKAFWKECFECLGFIAGAALAATIIFGCIGAVKSVVDYKHDAESRLEALERMAQNDPPSRNDFNSNVQELKDENDCLQKQIDDLKAKIQPPTPPPTPYGGFYYQTNCLFIGASNHIILGNDVLTNIIIQP